MFIDKFDCFRPAFCFLYSVQVRDVADENGSQAAAAPSVSVPHSKAVAKKPAAAKKAGAIKGKKFTLVNFLDEQLFFLWATSLSDFEALTGPNNLSFHFRKIWGLWQRLPGCCHF